jgi:acyl-CoA thioesterase-1
MMCHPLSFSTSRRWLLLSLILLAGCDPSGAPARGPSAPGPSPESSAESVRPPQSAAALRPRIIAFGNSLTAGLGVASAESYPAKLQRRLDAEGYAYLVVNAGVSGDTTAGGLRRLNWVLNGTPSIVVLELGGNDGLRGLKLEETRSNLEQMIRQLQAREVTVVLAGMKLPPNYGAEYTAQFESIYRDLASRYRVPLIPFFLEGVAAKPALNQADGIHPTAEGYEIVAETVMRTLEPFLKKDPQSTGTGGEIRRALLSTDGESRAEWWKQNGNRVRTS